MESIFSPIVSAFNTVFFVPILNILLLFYKLILSVGLPGALGFAIIALTAFIRLLLHPMNKKQMDSTKKLQDLKPQIDKIAAKYKNDKTRLNQEQLKLYQQAGINPAAGCLPLIIQIPFFIALFSTLNMFLANGGGLEKAVIEINKLAYLPYLKIMEVDPNFFGFNLALSPQKAGSVFYFIVPVLTILLTFLQFKFSTPAAPKKDVKGTEKDDIQRAMSVQMKFVLPAIFAYVSYTWPVGLSLYWNVFSIFSIIQYRKMHEKRKGN